MTLAGLSNSSTKSKSHLEVHELLDRFELLYDNLDELKGAIDELNTSWNGVASKMYDAAKDDTGKEDVKDSKTKTKGKSKKKDDAEIEDADFEVVD